MSKPLVRGLAALALVLIASATSLALSVQTVMVPMRDGTKLATQISLPSGSGPWPVIMIRTPYGKSGMAGAATMALQNGYGSVVQDFRGRFDSEGVDYPVFVHGGWGEHQDGYDTVEWIASQEWCNGKVGAFGISGPGIALNMMGPSRPPHLRCMFVSVAFSSMYHQAAYQGGAFRKALIENWLNGNRFHPRSLEIIREHPDYDDFWRSINPEEVMHRVNVPVMYVGGWYDIFSAGTINGFGIVHHKGGAGARGKCRLVMEAYGHGSSNELSFPNSGSPATANVFRWFDAWMKNDGRDADKIPVVHYYVMGDPGDKTSPGNEWRTADDWPVPAKPRPFCFRADGALGRRPVTKNNVSLSYKYDPANPVPTLGGANLTITKGPRDQRPIGDRPDVLTFTSDELDEHLEVTGAVKVKLWASSSATDTDFTAKLSDVYPDGREMIVLDGIIRARHRNSMAKSELMKPGKVYEFGIDLWSMSLVFSPGHRIRVAISSSNAPRFEPNPNTGKPCGTDDQTIVATNHIFLDADHPSHILLPIVEP
ncbi:MAG: CocE/NonD family hydrolase [Planctomycetes bacterium]|nr:CocE/NonD family hydrolase [Planctomycetota bacterium]